VKCSNCKREAEPDRVRCRGCLGRYAAHGRAATARKAAGGVCVRSGCHAPAAAGHTLCPAHLADLRRVSAAQAAIRRELAIEEDA
jgi:hypothetical protein